MLIEVLRKSFLVLIGLLTAAILLLFASMYFTYMPFWDSMNYHFPIRYFITECLKNDIVPRWCPYLYMGTPLYADPSSGFWNPINILLYSIFGFSCLIFKIEYALHMVLAGVGMYMLVHSISKQKLIASTLAIVYPLSGFFISHPPIYAFTMSMAWIPFVLYFFYQGFVKLQYKYFVWGGACLALCVLSGYIAFAVIACYVLFALFLYYFSKKLNSVGIGKLIAMPTVAAITFIVLTIGYFYSLIECMPYITRGDGVSLDKALINPFTPQSLLSLLYPFSTLVDTVFFDTEITMRNLYIGITAFPLLVVALLYGNRKQNIVLLLVAVGFLLVSFGAYTPARAWTYSYLPAFNMFRHPAMFRAGTLVALLLIAANGLSTLYSSQHTAIKRTMAITIGMVAIAIGVCFLLACIHGNIRLKFPNFSSVQSVFDFNSADNIWSNIIVQSAAQGLVLSALIICLLLFKHRNLAIAIAMVWFFDMALSAQMNLAGTIVCKNKVADFDAVLDKQPKGFSGFQNQKLGYYNTWAGDELAPMVYNANLIRKEVVAESYNPFVLSKCNKLQNTRPLFNDMLNSPIVFASSSMTEYEEDSLNGGINKGILITLDTSLQKHVEVLAFKVDTIKVRTSADAPMYVTLQQINYPGWQVHIDGVATEITETNYALITVPVAKGIHQIDYVFVPKGIDTLIMAEIVAWLMVVVYTLVALLRPRIS